MRLSHAEADTIKKAISDLDPFAKIFLYGSRVQDHLAGGDIDLIVISETLTFSEKLTILAEIKSKLGDQKIDLTLCNAAHASTLPFIVEAMKTAIIL